MRRALVGMVLVAAVLTGGCGSSDTAEETCAKARATIKYYTSEAPELKALTAEIEKAYQGTGTPDGAKAARLAYNKAFGDALRSIADRADDPGLKASVTAAADAYSASGQDLEAMQTALDQCPQKP
ncbi:hypothetical protein GCM10027610_037310 [Dactylosporangium cerinum]